MKRIVDHRGPHAPLWGEAVRLLRTAEEAHRPAPGSKARVRIALVRRPRPHTRPAPWLRAPVLLALALASALASGATVVRHWVSQATVDAAPAPPPVEIPAAPPPRRTLSLPAPVDVPMAPVASAEAPVGRAEVPVVRAVAPRLRAAQREVPAQAPRPSAEETAQLVLDAMAALRRDHDARRAQPLLDEYMRRSPDGPLAEEALALSIEAASALHDDRARLLAARYLAAYPLGRFRATAERVAPRSTP